VLCTTVVHNDTHKREQFSDLHVGLGLDFVFVCLFKYTIYISFKYWLSSFYSCVACICCVGFSFSVLSHELGWDKRLQNDLFCVGWDVTS